MQPQTPTWLWGRVAGDLVDLSSLAAALASDRNDRKKVAMGVAAVLGVTALDLVCAQALTRTQSNGQRQTNQKATESVIVNKSPEEVYQFWHDFSNLPKFMKHLESVRTIGAGRSRWRVEGPGGAHVEWDAEIIADEPNRLIRWSSVAGSDLANSGAVHFQPGPAGRGTAVKVELQYYPPAGKVGALIAKVMGKGPSQMLYNDLRALKQIMETGEVMKSDASIHESMHVARPPEHYSASTGVGWQGRGYA
jgi:uncharacterized membrane protein